MKTIDRRVEKMDKGNKGQDRLLWLDMLRALAACAVVMMHTLTGAVDIMNTAAYEGGQLMLLVMDLVTWSVPVFLIISGYLFLNPEKEISLKKMVTKYCVRIVLALLVFGIPFSCLELILAEKTFRIGMLWEGLFMVITMRSWSHLWYLYLILLLYLLTPAFKWMLKRLPYGVVVLCLIVLAVGSSATPFVNQFTNHSGLPVLPEGLIYAFYYVFGYCLHKEEKKVGASHMMVWGVVLLIVLGEMISYRLARDGNIQMAYNYPPTVILSVGLMFFAMSLHQQFRQNRWSPEKVSILRRGKKLMEGLAGMSFTVYLIHPFFLNLMYKFLHLSPVDYPVVISLPVFFGITLACSVAGAWILHKITPLRRHVL